MKDEEMLEYVLQETAVAVRIMYRDKSTMHVYDLGKSTDGIDLCMMLMVVPKDAVESLEKVFGTKPSIPLDDQK